jgi:hypothetical protein
MLTTQFFAMKIQRYVSEHGISQSTLGRVAEKAFYNGSLNENAWRRKPLAEQEILSSRMVNDPLTQYTFCSPGEGAVALVLTHGDRLRRAARLPVYVRSVAFRTRRFGSFEVFSPPIPLESAPPSPTTDAAAAAFEQAGIGPEDVDVAQVQDTESGAEVMHFAETGLCEHGEQEALIQSGRRPLTVACRSTPTVAGWPTASRSAPPGSGRCTRPPAARRRRRPPDPRSLSGRVHSGLRRSRCQCLHGPLPLESDDTWLRVD